MADGLLCAGAMPGPALLRLHFVACSLACSLAACGTEAAPPPHAAPLQATPLEATPLEATPLESTPPGTTAPGTTAPGRGSAEPPAIALLPAEARTALEATPVAMLVLPADRAAGTTVLVGERWAALHFRDEALTISLHATDVSHPVVGDDEVAHLPPPADTVRGRPARVLLNEQIRSVAWEEGPVSYALEVECARPLDDARCTEPDFVLELADALVAVPRGAR